MRLPSIKFSQETIMVLQTFTSLFLIVSVGAAAAVFGGYLMMAFLSLFI